MRFYTVETSSAALSETDAQTRRDVSTPGTLGGTPSAKPVGPRPRERTVSGYIRGDRADLIADMLQRLADAPGFGTIPVFDLDNPGPDDGFYAISSLSSNAAEPQTRGTLHEFSGTLQKVATQQQRFQGVKTSPSQVVHTFGNDTETVIGIDANATRVQWLDPATKQLSPATATDTVTGEHGPIDHYDVDEPPFDTPTLIYKLSFDRVGNADLSLWDDRGLASKTDASGRLQWAKIFSPDYAPAGQFVFDNGLLRVFVDDEASTLSAETWDTGTDSWSAVSLGTSDWQPIDVDLLDVSPAGVEAQVTFENTTDDSLFALDGRLHRGWSMMHWATPESETDPIPSGLETLLAPIASSRVVDPDATHTLVDRDQVRL